MKHKKPSGYFAFTRISSNGEEVKSEFNEISFSSNKEEIEWYFCHQFCYQMIKSGATINEVIQNEENNFDFTLKVPSGAIYLELTEVVINKKGQSPYSSQGNQWIRYQEFVNAAIKIISKKSTGYQKSDIPIHLLMYNTHWGFAPNHEIIALLQYDLKRIEHSFENIFYYNPIDETEGELRVLFPSSLKYLDGFDMEQLRERVSIVLDMKNGSYFKEE